MEPLQIPPDISIPIEHETWKRWLGIDLWAAVGKDGKASFPKLTVNTATFSGENDFQELLNCDKGIYVTYRTTNQNIVYGFACNVYRAAGNAFVVGAQINAYAERGVTSTVFGMALTAVAQPGCSGSAIVAFEPDTACLSNANQNAKWGMNPVFKNRGDGAGTAPDTLGANQYNYFTVGCVFSSQLRSSLGEYCGWNVGVDFLDYSMDQDNPPNWSALTKYIPGQCVISGGLVWKAITYSTNQVPAAGSAYWVQRTAAGVANLGVCIDFSSMSIGAMARVASVIRLRSTQKIHWEETGAVSTNYDAVNGVHRVSDNQGTLKFGVDQATGNPIFGNAPTAPGGGAAAVLGTIGGAGPAVAAQNGWMKGIDSAGNAFFIPVWR